MVREPNFSYAVDLQDNFFSERDLNVQIGCFLREFIKDVNMRSGLLLEFLI